MEEDPLAANGATRSVRLVHSSDLHLGGGHSDRPGLEGLQILEAVLGTARHLHADMVLLVGDVFDHNRVSDDLVEGAAEILEHARLPVVILPGNHDCLTPLSVYHRGVEAPSNVHVIGMTVEDRATFPELDLDVWGRAHFDYFDMVPLHEPPPRELGWRIAAAHGHWVAGPNDEHRSYLIRAHELAQLDADYLALGHWDVPTAIGAGSPPAYYSGAPTFGGTVNLVSLDPTEGTTVSREPLHH